MSTDRERADDYLSQAIGTAGLYPVLSLLAEQVDGVLAENERKAGEAIAAAEARGYRKAIERLRTVEFVFVNEDNRAAVINWLECAETAIDVTADGFEATEGDDRG